MINFPHAYSGSVRQPKESVQFVYSEPEVFTEGPDLMAGEAEMALYRSHVRHAEGPERAAGYHEVLLFSNFCTPGFVQGCPVATPKSYHLLSSTILGHRLSQSAAGGPLGAIFLALKVPSL